MNTDIPMYNQYIISQRTLMQPAFLFELFILLIKYVFNWKNNVCYIKKLKRKKNKLPLINHSKGSTLILKLTLEWNFSEF